MSNYKNGKIAVKEICVIAMLLAITVVLSYLSGYLRIGTAIKFSVSFISVYMAAALYGPAAGGFVGAMADIISCIVNPVGPLIWQLTVIELFYGVLYGMFFGINRKKNTNKKTIFTKAFMCSLIQFLVNIFVKTKILSEVGYVPGDFLLSVSIRLPSGIAMFVVTAAVLVIAEKHYTDKFCDIINK